MNPPNDPFHLNRFVEAQDDTFDQALAELQAGAKARHWMWFIFPQIAGLGQSTTSRFFAIQSLEEAKAYLDHPLLGPRLRQSVEALLGWEGKREAAAIFGSIDAMKLRSSLTLFDAVADDLLFGRALEAFFEDGHDQATLELLRRQAGI